MIQCYYCKNLVNSTNSNNTIYFCSKYCLEISTRGQGLSNPIFNKKHIVTHKLCYGCYQKIDNDRPTYHYNDHIFCSSRCRSFLINIY